jgi:hypothetical protein
VYAVSAGCVDQHGVALQVGDRVALRGTITAIDAAPGLLQIRVLGNAYHAGAVPIRYINAWADHVCRLDEPPSTRERDT